MLPVQAVSPSVGDPGRPDSHCLSLPFALITTPPFHHPPNPGPWLSNSAVFCGKERNIPMTEHIELLAGFFVAWGSSEGLGGGLAGRVGFRGSAG